MRKNIDELYPREIANMVKIDSNDMEARVGVDLVKLVEEGLVEVVGLMDGQLLYQAVKVCESENVTVG